LDPHLGRKYEAILTSERAVAKRVASSVIRPRPLTVWDVTLPPILIYNLLRLKAGRDVFSKNFLFTKQLAMDEALEIARGDRNMEEAMSRAKGKTDDVLAADSQGIYSHDIRQAQMKEIELLIGHYYRLLEAEGNDYASLVVHAYGTRDRYGRFLVLLKRREAEVKHAAMETLKTDKPPEIVALMESAIGRLRIARADEIFGSHTRKASDPV